MKALLLIDIQNDFLPGGALAVKDGDQVIAVANRLMSQYELVVATMDWHPANHQSFASQHPGRQVGEIIQWNDLDQVLWPNHCVQGTHGAQLAAALDRDRISEVIQKGTDPNLDSYSGFFDNAHRKATGLEDCLRRHEADEVDLIGLATDYCVKYTALDAIKLGFRTAVLTEGVRGVELKPGDCQQAIDEMRTAGAEIK
jgi:nicotinamidase/pyrazinamidase